MPTTGPASPLTLTGLTNDVEYQARVRARNAAGWGPWSALSDPFIPVAGGGALSYADEVLADTPLLYWRLGEASGTTAQDATAGNRDGTVSGATPAAPGLLAGDANTAYSFDGADDKVSYATTPLTAADSWTLEAWAKLADLGNQTGLMVCNGMEAAGGYGFGFRSDSPGLALWVLLNGQAWVNTGYTFSDTSAHHIVAKRAGGNLSAYVDGVRVYGPTAQACNSASGALILGQFATLSYFYEGVLDEAAAYGTALSDDRIAAHYRAAFPAGYSGDVLADRPLLYWRLGEASGTVAEDASPNNRDGAISGATLAVAGALSDDANTAFELDGTDDRVTLAGYVPFANGTVRTFEGWAWRDNTSNYHHLFGAVGTDEGLRLETASNSVYFLPGGQGGYEWSTAWPGTAQWVHWALVTDEPNNTAELFINGVSKGLQTFTWSWGSPTGTILGARNASGLPFDGKLDEFAVYPTALSPARIAAHYYEGRPSAYRNAVLASGPRVYWRLGEATGTAANDETANNLDGTYVNTPTLGVAGPLVGDTNTAVTLTASSSERVERADEAPLDYGDVFTLEAWVKMASTGDATNRTILGKGAGTGTIRLADGLAANPANSLELLNSHTAIIAASTIALTDTNWHHVVATKDGATAKLYIDGVDRTGTVTNSTCINNANDLRVGADSDGSNNPLHHFAGSIDEAAVYPTALSSAEVLEHYEAGT